MIANTFLSIAQALRPAAGLLLFLVWWPHRKTRLLTSVPWIVVYFAVFDLGRWWNVTASGRLLHAQPEGGSTLMGFLVLMSFMSQARFFLIAAMVAINLAFLLENFAPANRFQSFLARQQRFQHLLGVLLLFFLFAPGLVAWVTRLAIAGR